MSASISPAALVERSERFVRAISAIDAANADDPETLVVDGVTVPKEQTHAELVCAWVLRFDPDATDAQLLAARAHHLRRWELPRSDYPDDRAGYLRWRTEQKKRHAELVASILGDVGYDGETVERVGQIIRKEGLRRDPQVQTHEDALCLTFLETQFDPVAAQLGDDKTVDVLVKTIKKMSPAAIEAATALDLSGHEAELLARAAAQFSAD